MTQSEIFDFKKSLKGTHFKSIVELRNEIEDELNACGLGIVKDLDEAKKLFLEDGFESEVFETDTLETFCYADNLCFIVQIKEYYVDPGSIDYYYSYELISF